MDQYYHKSKFNLYIDNSKIINSGLGVFTKEFIPKDSFIDEYYGEIIDYLYGGDYYFKIDKDYGINAEKFPRCYMAMLNDAGYKPLSKRKLKKFIEHSFINNCYFKIEDRKIKIFSKDDILERTELFISYGSEYWNN
jgi:SET domain-containing protein